MKLVHSKLSDTAVEKPQKRVPLYKNKALIDKMVAELRRDYLERLSKQKFKS